MSGGPARYINHSCFPNCVAENVQFERDSKIIIITKRKINKGEEVVQLHPKSSISFITVSKLPYVTAAKSV